jgi:hypothetical protein
MPRGLGVRKVTLSQIIFIFVDNKGSSQQVARFDSVNQIAIMSWFRSMLFYIPKIACVPRFLRTWHRTMVTWLPNMKVFAGTHASFTS